jgi:GGDEF domain-containing protein
VQEQEYVLLANKAAIGVASPDDYQRIAELEQLQQVETGGQWGPLTSWIPATVRMAPMLVGGAVAHVVGGAVGGFIGGKLGVEAGGVVGGVATAPVGGEGAVPGAAVAGTGGAAFGSAVGQRTADFAYMFAQNFGPAYLRFKGLKNSEGGHLLDDDEARLLAAGASGLGAALMGGFQTKMLAKLPGMKSIMQRLGTDAVSVALKDSTKQGVASAGLTALRTLATRGSVDLAHGALVMAGQAGANAGSAALARGTHGEAWDLAGVATETGHAFLQALQDMPGLVLLGAGTEAFHDYRSARKGVEGLGQADRMKQDSMRLASAVEGAKEAKLQPEKLEEFARLAQGGRAQGVFIDAEAWRRHAEKRGMDPAQLAADIAGDGGKAHAEQLATGGDVRFAMEKYLAHLKDFHVGDLELDARLRPEALSINQARALMETRAREAADVSPPAADGAEAVRQDILKKALEADVPEKVAEAVAAASGVAFRNLGKGIGKDALNAYEDLAELRIFGPGQEAPRPSADFEFGANLEPRPPPQIEMRLGAIAEGLAAIERMQPANREAAQAFYEYTQGKRERPKIESDLEKRLANYGIVDPEGYTYDEQGRSLNRPGAPGRKSSGRQNMPADLQRFYDDNATLRRVQAEDAIWRRWKLKSGPASFEDTAPADSHALLRRLRAMPPEGAAYARAEELYRDHVSGLRTRRAWDETPRTPGKAVAVITSPDVKGINDNFVAGGHDVANGMLRAMGAALAPLDEGAARSGTNFLLEVDGANPEAGLKVALERVREALPPGQKFHVEGGTGADVDAAFKALDTRVEEKRTLKEVPPRGELAPGFDVGKLAFGEGKAQTPLPAHLTEKAGAMGERQFFEHTYLDKAADGTHTGLLSAEGERALPPAQNSLAMDMRGLKLANEKYGKATGDAMVKRFSQAMVEAGAGDVRGTHRSGDEFSAGHDDPQRLLDFANDLKGLLSSITLEARNLATGELETVQVDFRYGIGRDYGQADRALNAGRLLRGAGDAEAARVAADSQPSNAPDRGLEPQRQADLAAGDVGRGVQPADARGVAESPRGDSGQAGSGPQRYPGEAGVTRLKQPAWHGTRHDFEKFSLHAMGSGEGDQVYGWGLYFAGNKQVAEFYRESLTRGLRPEIDGRDVNFGDDRELAASFVLNNGSRAKALKTVRQVLGQPNFAGDRPQFERLEKLLASKKRLPEATRPSGQVFHVDVPENHELLDYDKPLAEQPPGVVEALERAGLVKPEEGTSPEEARSPDRYVVRPDGRHQSASSLTGKDVYEALVESTGSPEKASKALDAAGIPGMRYLDEGSRNAKEGTHNYVVWREERIRVLNKLYQTPEGTFTLEKKGDRGYIEFTAPDGSGKPRHFDIHLLESADKSTFAHETAHFLFEVMGDAAQHPDATPELKADYQRALDFMGHASHEERQANAEERNQLARLDSRTPEQEARLKALTAKEERISHAFEQYLLEGKSPSVELAPVFSRFKRWLTAIYKGVRGIARTFRREYGEEIGLSDEVRGVFDRLLASEDAVQEAEAAQAAQPFEAARAAMSPAELAEYADATDRGRDIAETQVQRLILQAQREETTAFMESERARIREDVEAELDAQPVYSALKLLQGDNPLGGEPLRLDRKAFVRKYGADAARALPREVFAKEGGVSAEEAALRTGWDSGDDFARALQAAPPREEAVTTEVQKRMEDAYGVTILDNGPALAAAAMDAVHTPVQARKVVLELNALRRILKAGARDVMSADRAEMLKTQDVAAAEAGAEAGRQRKLREELLHGFDFRDAQDMAKRLMAEKTVMELTSGEQGIAGTYLRNERTAARTALEAAAKGNLEGAIAWKERQLLNMALYREARDARAELERYAEKLRGAGKGDYRAYLGKAAPVYRDAHDAILQAIGLQEVPAGRAPLDLSSLVAAADAAAQELDFDVEGLRGLAAKPRPWWSLTTEEARNVVDAITNIRTAAREATTLQLEGKVMARDAFFEALSKTVEALPLEKPQPRDKNLMPFSQKARGILQHFDSLLLNTETMVGMLTGGDRESVAHKLLVDGYLAARNHEAELAKQFLEGLSNKWESMPKELREKRSELVDISKELPVPEDVADAGYVDPTGKVQRTQLWMMALNMGNEGNQERLLGGYRWSKDQVMRVLDREMTKAEWDWVQGVWDSLEGLYPLIEAVHEKETGLKPGKVVATKVVTPHGEYRGGYFPARYDSRFSTHGAKQAEGPGDVSQIFGSAYQRPVVSSGHAKARAENYSRPVELNWSVVPGHVAQVLHDVAFRSYVKQTAGILMDSRMRTLLTKRLGPEYAGQFIPWLQSVATARADAVPANVATSQRVVGWMRSRAATQALGLNLGVALGDFSNPFVGLAAGELKPLPLAHAVYKTVAHWGDIRKFALENSGELRFRGERVGKKLLEQLGDMGGGKPKSALERAIHETAFIFMEWSDKLTATPMWLAKYQEVLAEGKSHEDAVRAGDDVIRKFFPAEHVSEGPAFTRNKLTGAVVMFYGYMNKVYNLQRELVSRATDVWRDEGTGYGTKAGAVAKAAGRILAVSAAVGGMSEFLSGRGPEDDESYAEWLLRKTLLGPISTLPLVGQLVEPLIQKLSGKTATISVRQSPGLATMQKMVETIGSAVQAVKGDEVKSRDLLNGLELLGMGANIPTRQLRKTGGYAVGLATGDVTPRGPLDAASGIIYGKRDKQGANPFTAAQDVVSGQ